MLGKTKIIIIAVVIAALGTGFIGGKILYFNEKYGYELEYAVEDDADEHKKDVSVEEDNCDPIGYFSAISMIGQSYSYVDNKYSLKTVNQTDSWILMESDNGKFEFAFRASDTDDEMSDYYHIAPTDNCYRMSGLARDIFGITTPVSISDFESVTNTVLGYGPGADLDTAAKSGMVELIKLPGQSKYYHMLLEDVGYSESIMPDAIVHVQGYFNEGEIIREG